MGTEQQDYFTALIDLAEQARDWNALPWGASDQIKRLQADIKPHIGRHCIRARVMLGQAQDFADLRAALAKAVDEHERKLAKVRAP